MASVTVRALGYGRAPARLLAFLLAATLAGACTLAYDADRNQCSVAADCASAGVNNRACIDGLCQSPEPALDATVRAAAGLDAGAARGDAGLQEAVAAAERDRTDTDRASTSLPDSPRETPDAAGTPSDAGGTLTAEAGNAARDAAADAAADARVPTRDSSVCSGSGCPGECRADADCEQRGFAGGTCADSICWPATLPAQCKSDADCPALGPEYAGGRCLSSRCRPNPRWRCEHPAPPAEGSATKKLTALVRDSLSLSPLAGIRALICPKLDLQCTAPIGEATTPADGILTINVPANFAGYLKVEDKKYFPAMYFLPSALPSDGVLQPFPLLSGGLIVDALAFALGTGIDPRRGHLMLVAEDCMGAALPGVTFKTAQQDTRTVQFYVRDLLPSTNATQTAEAGNGGYLNFPAGTAVISLQHVETGIKLTTVSVVVRAGFISVAYIRPDLR